MQVAKLVRSQVVVCVSLIRIKSFLNDRRNLIQNDTKQNFGSTSINAMRNFVDKLIDI